VSCHDPHSPNGSLDGYRLAAAGLLVGVTSPADAVGQNNDNTDKSPRADATAYAAAAICAAATSQLH